MLDEYKNEVETVFLLLDPNSAGAIILNDAIIGLKALEVTASKADLEAYLKKNLQIENTNVVSQKLFLETALAFKRNITDTESIKRSFQILDEKQNGYICADHLKTKIMQLGLDIPDELIMQMIKVADQNEKGYVTMDDFIRVIKISSEYLTSTKLTFTE